MQRRMRRNFLAVLVLAAAAPLGAQTEPTPASPADQPAVQGQSDSQTKTQNPNPTQGANPGQGGAQDNTGQGQTQGQTQESESQTVKVPLSLDMNEGSLEFTSEALRENYLEGGVNVSTTYDSNLLSQSSSSSSSTQPVGGFTYSINPRVGLRIVRRRLSWGMNYAFGYVIDQKYSAYDEASHNASFNLKYRLSPHSTLSLTDNFSRIPQLVNQLPDNMTPIGAGPIQAPNPAVIVDSLALVQNNTGTAQITYQYSATDVVGASATSNIIHYDQPAGATSTGLLNSQSYEADGFYNRRFSRRNWGGVTYSFQRSSLSPGSETFDTESALLLYTLYLRPSVQLSIFAGPEYSSLSTEIITTVATPPTVSVTAVPSTDKRWSASTGGTFSWQGLRTSANVTASRKISDGGGLGGAVELLSASAGVRRKITHLADLEFDAVYGDSNALDKAASNFTRIHSPTDRVTREQHITRNIVASLGYAREYQKEEMQSAPALDINHSSAWFTIGYELSKALGR